MACILKFGAKVGIFGGIVYSSRKIGIWENSDVTYELGKNCVAFVAPHINKLEKEIPFPVEIKNLPSTNDVCRAVRSYWNKGVISSIAIIEKLPCTITCYTKKGINYVIEVVQQEIEKKPIVKESS